MRMDRRSFLKALLAGAGLSVLPAFATNILPKVNVVPLTIYCYGAGKTEDHFIAVDKMEKHWVIQHGQFQAYSETNYIGNTIRGFDIRPPSDRFPKEAITGDMFFFDPDGKLPDDGRLYDGDPNDLVGMYIWDSSQWLLIAATNTVHDSIEFHVKG